MTALINDNKIIGPGRKNAVPKGRPGKARRIWVRLHRWLSIGAAAFWMLQAITGILLGFHWEIQDAMLGMAHKPTDFLAMERQLDALAPVGTGARINSIYTTAGLPDRYEINMVSADSTPRLIHIDGVGHPLRDRPASEPTFLGLMLRLHVDLMSGATGQWIMAISGILLITNLIMGLILAWPRRGWWRQAITPARKGPLTARIFTWHRAIGLWAVIPALVVVTSGTLMLFHHGVATLLDAEKIRLPANPPQDNDIGFAAAARAAERAISQGKLASMVMPDKGDASYYIRIRAAGDLCRAYGSSLVIIDANDGRIRSAYPMAQAHMGRKILGAFYPVHTGEAGGLIGRILVLGTGLWLLTMLVLGIWLWLRKRRKPAR